MRTPIIKCSADGMESDHEDTKPYELRSGEIEIVTLDDSDVYVSVFDLRQNTRLSSGLGICRTLFVCFIL